MKLKNPKLIAIGAGVVVFAAALGGGILVSQSSGSSAASPAGAGGSGSQSILSLLESSVGQDAASPTPGTGKGEPNATVEDFLQKLAARLGISEETLKSDLQQTSIDELQQLVKDGKLTQAQADKIQGAITNGTDYFPGLNGGFGGRGARPAPGAFGQGGFGGLSAILGKNEAALAQWLGISTGTLQSDLKGGQSLAAIATTQGKTTADLKTFLTNELDTQLKAEVTAGKLTQAQSDKISAGVVANLDTLINGKLPMFAGPRSRKAGPPPGAASPAPSPGSSTAPGGGNPSTTS
ncbi:MAG: hypothetical protein ACRDG3_05210 [Tepidiformaceae bacterium]